MDDVWEEQVSVWRMCFVCVRISVPRDKIQLCVVFLSVVAAWFHHVPNEKSCLWEIHIIPIADIPILVLFLLG